MQPRAYEWRGDAMGHLVFASAPEREIGSPERLVAHLREQGVRCSEEELELLGGFAFLLCLREVRIGRAGAALGAAARALDANLPPVPDSASDAAFRKGVTQLEEHLFATRGEPARVLAYLAHLYLTTRVAERGE